MREPWEIAAAAIAAPDARLVLVPMREIPARLAELDPVQPSSVSAITVPAARRSSHSWTLRFESVYNLAGGIDAWSQDVDPSVARY